MKVLCKLQPKEAFLYYVIHLKIYEVSKNNLSRPKYNFWNEDNFYKGNLKSVDDSSCKLYKHFWMYLYLKVVVYFLS